MQSSEAGIGTQTIPHSMAETDDPANQGILAMLSTYSAGCVCLLSSLVTLITETWLDPTLSLGIEMVASSFALYFSQWGVALVILSAFLFAFGTILGNSFNGSVCYTYVMNHRFSLFYYVGTVLLVFFGCLADVRVIWALVDYLLIPVAIPHILSIAYLNYRQKHLLSLPATD